MIKVTEIKFSTHLKKNKCKYFVVTLSSKVSQNWKKRNMRVRFKVECSMPCLRSRKSRQSVPRTIPSLIYLTWVYWQEGSNRKDVLNPWEITETQTANESEASPQEIHNGWAAVTCFPVNTDMVTARTDDDKQINHGALLALMASIEFSSNAAMDGPWCRKKPLKRH